MLAQIRNNYYFYRGVDWPGFIENANYGDDVSEHLTNLLSLDTSAYPWSFYANTKEVYLNNTPISVDQVESIRFDTDVKAFKNVLYQLQVIMSPEQLKTVQKGILKIVAVKERDIRQSPHVKKLIEEGRFKDIKQFIKDKKAIYVDIVSLLQNAISLQKSSSKKHDLNRLMRKEAISANVEKAATKTIGDMIDELCTELGTISCLIDNNQLHSLLTNIKTGTLVGWLKEQECGYLTNVTNICSRMNVLDGTTTSALLDNDSSNTSYVCPSLSIQNIYEQRQTYQSIMFLPLHDKTYKDPYAVSWPNEANDENVALLRIKLRNIIASAIEEGFSPANKEIGYIIIYLYFCILEKLTHGVTPSTAEDSAVRNISRAIVSSILCVASSGQSPLSLYHIVSHNAHINVPDSSIWWMYFKLRALWKYTGWNEEIIDKKFKHFVVKCVRKYIVDPVTSKLRKTNNKRKIIKINKKLVDRNRELEWLKTAIPVIQSREMLDPYHGIITTRGGAIVNKYLKQEPGASHYEYVLRVCADIVKKRSKNNWKVDMLESPDDEFPVDKRLNLKNLPDFEEFKFTNIHVLRNMVKALFDNHMNIEQSEEIAIQYL